ncbi:hypothetical protein D3C73_1474280 [compost metagenome]
MLKRSSTHVIDVGDRFVSFCIKSAHAAELSKVRTNEYEQTCDKYGFGYTSFNVGSCLERFARLFGEAVQVKTIIPVCTTDERQAVWSKIVNNMIEGAVQMLE